MPGEGTRVRRLESYLPTLTGLLDGRLGVRRWYLARLADSANTIHGFILNDGELIRASRARGVGESFAPCAHRNGTARIVCRPLTVSVGA